MALYSDKWWLLSHINHSFVLSDDTGNSELVMTAREAKDLKKRVLIDAEKEGTLDFVEPLTLLEEADDFLPNSFEIRLGRSNLGYHHRPRCNTEIQLEKLKRDRRNLPKIRTVNWKENTNPLTEEVLEELFPAEPEIKIAEKKKPVVSLLSYQLENFSSEPENNPFQVFAKFDGGSASTKEKIRTFNIYLGMAKGKDRDFPMRIQVDGNAKVQEVIGFTCWTYTRQNRSPILIPNVESYALYMAEEDGTIEKDFPPLDRRDPISKFGFTTLGLVELGKKSDDDTTDGANQKRVTVVLPDGTFTIIELETRDIPLKDLMEKAFSRHKMTTRNFNYNYNLEKRDFPGEALDQESLLSGYETNEFYIVRENSKRKVEEEPAGGSGKMKSQISVLEANMYKEYTNVFIYNKVRTRVEVVLCVSEQKLEIYPKQVVNAAKFWKRQKSISYNMDGIVACDIVNKKGSGNWVFRLIIHTDHGYKKYNFECADIAAMEIHSKITHILNWRQSEAMCDYLLYKDRKTNRRGSRSFIK